MNIMENHHVNRFCKELFGIILAGMAVVYANEPMYIALAPIITRARSMIVRHFGWGE